MEQNKTINKSDNILTVNENTKEIEEVKSNNEIN